MEQKQIETLRFEACEITVHRNKTHSSGNSESLERGGSNIGDVVAREQFVQGIEGTAPSLSCPS